MIKSALRSAILGMSLLASNTANALTFNFSLYGSDSLTVDQQNAFNIAAAAWSSVLTDNVTVNIQIGFAALGANILGQTSLSEGSVGYASVVGQLAANATSAADAIAVNTLQNTPPYSSATSVFLTSANARALGYFVPSNTVDAIIQFSTAFTFQTSRNPDGSINGGAFDLIGVAEHELGHALGFISDVGIASFAPTVLDLFRYQPGSTTPSGSTGDAAFSIDGGVTDIASFSDGLSHQSSHWLTGTLSGGGTALMNPSLGMGLIQNITPLDLTALDVIGWTTVPEPASLLLLSSAVAVLPLLRRRRRGAR
jgi:hypothetical protein